MGEGPDRLKGSWALESPSDVFVREVNSRHYGGGDAGGCSVQRSCFIRRAEFVLKATVFVSTAL